MRDIVTVGERGGHVTVGTTEYADVPVGVAVGAYQASLTSSSARMLARLLDQLAKMADLAAEIRTHNANEAHHE